MLTFILLFCVVAGIVVSLTVNILMMCWISPTFREEAKKFFVEYK